ncbi:MAG TPA: hypothetical protein VGU22_07965 [Methylomirabilota bacterium]|jgi:hypothetical protein|nr:hypothetical protein [Methylomirabilota bacterium]
MAQDPREQQETDAERIPEGGTGKIDQDTDRLGERDRLRRRATDIESAGESEADQPPA